MVDDNDERPSNCHIWFRGQKTTIIIMNYVQYYVAWMEWQIKNWIGHPNGKELPTISDKLKMIIPKLAVFRYIIHKP